MTRISYETIVLIGNASNFSFDKLLQSLKQINWGGHQVKITKSKDKISIKINEWNFYIIFNCEDYVVQESVEMANSHAKEHILFNEIRNCTKRLEIGGDPDFNMDYFNDFCLILEKIETFKDVYTFDVRLGFQNI